MTVGEIKNEARERFAINRYQAMLAYSLLFTIILNLSVVAAALCIISSSINVLVSVILWWYALVMVLAVFILYAPFQYSMTNFYLKSYRAQKVELSAVMDGFNKYNLERVIIMHLVRFALWLAFTLLLIVPGVIFAVRTSMSLYLLRANPKMKPVQALKASNKIMKGHCRKYFVLIISFAGWALFSLLTLGVGIVWVAPYMNTSKVVFYKREIQGDKESYSETEDYDPEEDDDKNVAAKLMKLQLVSEIKDIDSKIQTVKTTSDDKIKSGDKVKTVPLSAPANNRSVSGEKPTALNNFNHGVGEPLFEEQVNSVNRMIDNPPEDNVKEQALPIVNTMDREKQPQREYVQSAARTETVRQPILDAQTADGAPSNLQKPVGVHSNTADIEVNENGGDVKQDTRDAIKQRIEQLKAERERRMGTRPARPSVKTVTKDEPQAATSTEKNKPAESHNSIKANEAKKPLKTGEFEREFIEVEIDEE